MQQGRPVFRVTIVGRTVPAVNYRPRRGDTELDMVGTALMPRARGEIEVSGKKGYMEITGEFDRIDPPTQFGPEYLTYVMWAITPEGRATNLGELQIEDERRVRVTTELQAFGLIVTAEPYFAVTQPSDVVIMENAVKRGTDGRIETIDAKYELLKRGTYVMNQDYAELKVKAPEPGTQLDLAQARNAVALAGVAGANEYAADTYAKAAGAVARSGTGARAAQRREHRAAARAAGGPDGRGRAHHRLAAAGRGASGARARAGGPAGSGRACASACGRRRARAGRGRADAR